MKANVDPELCEGCETCVELCPEVFVMEGDIAKAIVSDIPEAAQDSCQEAADSCPVEAITIES